MLERKNVAVCSGNHQAANKSHSVLNVFSGRDIGSGTRLTPRTASFVPAVGQHYAHVPVKSTTRFQFLQVSQIIEGSIFGEAVPPHGYL